jgi:hypothetical protein
LRHTEEKVRKRVCGLTLCLLADADSAGKVGGGATQVTAGVGARVRCVRTDAPALAAHHCVRAHTLTIGCVGACYRATMNLDPNPKQATINYTLSDHGTHYVISPRCYFDTKGNKAKVKLDAETGKLMIKPRIKAKQPDAQYRATTTQFINGGYLIVPKKCDLSKPPRIRHEGPKGQLLEIDIDKLPEYQTEPFTRTLHDW